MGTIPDEGDRVERVIVDSLAAFLDVSTSDAEANPILAAALGRLLKRLLDDYQGWSSYAWIDDAKPDSMTRVDASTVVVVGLATIVNGERSSSQPFRGTFRLDPMRTRLDAFRLSLGDARSDIQAVPYGTEPPYDWPNVPGWTFTFDRMGADLPG